MLVACYPSSLLATLDAPSWPFDSAAISLASWRNIVLEFIHKFQPDIVFLELPPKQMLQVAEPDGNHTPLDSQNDQLLAKYICATVLANCCEFRLPQSRNRLCLLYLRRDRAKPFVAPKQLEDDMLPLGCMFFLCSSPSLLYTSEVVLLLCCPTQPMRRHNPAALPL